MRRILMLLLGVLSLARCASFRPAGEDGGVVLYESINRDSVLLRFSSSPPGARAAILCEGHDRVSRTLTTPGNARLPVRTHCSVRFSKEGFVDEVAEFDAATYAHPAVLSSSPSCFDPGVWCEDVGYNFADMLFRSLVYGTAGLVARAFDGGRQGRGEIGAILLPLSEAPSGPAPPDDGSDTAPPGG